MTLFRDQRRAAASGNADRHGTVFSACELAGFYGVCAGASLPEIVSCIGTRHDAHQFRVGFTVTGIVCALMILFELAILDAVHAHAREACPAGYRLVEKICVSSTTGDIVLPDKLPDHKK